MIKRAFIMTCLSLAFGTVLVARTEAIRAAVADETKERTRLEELFIWKASEELRLPPEQETKFTEIIRTLNSRRRKAAERMDLAVKGLVAAKAKPDAERALATHRDVVKEYHAIQVAELDQLKALMGPEKFARYLIVKNEITEKLKELLSRPTKTAPSSAAPKIIEEK